MTDLDAQVAEKVMGWKPYSRRGAYSDGSTWTHPDGYNTSYGSWPAYSIDIAAAWLVVEKMRERGYGFMLSNLMGEWQAAFMTPDGSKGMGAIDTAPLAICRAALAAMGET